MTDLQLLHALIGDAMEQYVFLRNDSPMPQACRSDFRRSEACRFIPCAVSN